jgi:hypothetical protein
MNPTVKAFSVGFIYPLGSKNFRVSPKLERLKAVADKNFSYQLSSTITSLALASAGTSTTAPSLSVTKIANSGHNNSQSWQCTQSSAFTATGG